VGQDGHPGANGVATSDATSAPVRPAVVFGPGPRPETATQVHLAEFEGPLGLLLSLIEGRRLDVMTVPLGALAEAYLDALARLESDRISNISSFVAVASQLILIKSRALLPRAAPPDPAGRDDDALDPEAELRARLLLYRAHRDAGLRLAAGAAARVGLFRREPRLAQAAAMAGARSPRLAPLDPATLVRALDGLVEIAPVPRLPPEVVPRTITLAERVAAIRDALRLADSIVLQELVRGVRDRTVVAVTFLAMLELSKRREIAIDQAVPFGPIFVRRTTAEERAAAGLAAAAEVEPIDESMAGFR
jgi:segregation and condensation protein A